MNRWINWLIDAYKPAPVAVKPEAEVRVSGDKVFYSLKKGYRETVIDLTQLQYLYLYSTENTQNLVLNDYHQHFIPCSAIGFEVFFKYLLHQLSLDPAKFFENLAHKKPVKLELWRAEKVDNCQVTGSADQTIDFAKELAAGFWVCASPRQWISWDMTSEALAGLPCVYQTTNEYGLTEIRFHYPVRLGNLLLDDWRYYLPHVRLDVPLDNFYTNLRIKGNGDQNYFLVKNALCEMMGEAIDGFERKDQNACHWLFNGLKFSLVYWYDSASSYESGYAFLSVQNERIYPDYLTDHAYELNGTFSKFLFLQHDFQIGSDFRRSPYFKRTPQIVASRLTDVKNKFIIWIDEPGAKVGFANRDNAMIFPLGVLIKFQLQNVTPGRSGGGCYFSATLTEGSQQSILIGDCYALDPYMSKMAELVLLPVFELTPYEE